MFRAALGPLNAALIILGVTVAACDTGTQTSRQEPDPSFIEGVWGLESLVRNGEAYDFADIVASGAPAGEPAWIRFDNDGTFTGQAPCNTFSGRYHFDGRVLEIPETSGTAAGCVAIDPETGAVDESVNRAETAIFEAIVGPVAMEVTFSGPDSSVTEWASLTAVLTFRRG